MKESEKLIDFIRHAERHNDPENPSPQSDEETKKLQLTISETRMALAKEKSKDVDIDKEWEKFSSAHPSKRHGFSWRNIAAILICVVIVSGVSLAAFKSGIFKFTPAPEKETKEIVAEKPHTNNNTNSEKAATSDTKKIFENEPLEQVLSEMAKYYNMELVFRDETARNLRIYYEWDTQEPIAKVIEELNNFERLNLNTEGSTLVVEQTKK